MAEAAGMALSGIAFTQPVDGYSNGMPHAGLRGLSDIDMVLEQTNELCKRYSYLPLGKDEPITTTSSAEGCHTGQSHHQGGEVRDMVRERGERRVPGAWYRLGKKVCWAVQDKRRFDRLISDLEFLLSNIEKLVSSFQGDTGDHGLPETRVSPVISHEKGPQNLFHIPGQVKQKRTPGRPSFHHMSSSHSTRLADESSNVESQAQTKPKKSAKRMTQPQISLSTPKAEDRFIRNKVEQAGLIWRSTVSTPQGEVLTTGPVCAEENEVKGSVMVLGPQTSADLDKVLNHLKEMRNIEVSVKGVSPSSA